MLAYIILYAIVGDTAAPPDGVLYQLILLTICSYFGGWLMGLTTFPPLVGMLFTGMLLQNVNVVNIDEEFSEITSEVRYFLQISLNTSEEGVSVTLGNCIKFGKIILLFSLFKIKFSKNYLSVLPSPVRKIPK